MRLCYLCNEYPPGPHGGIGSLTRTLAQMMTAAGHEVRVVGMYPASYPGPDAFLDGDVQVQRLRIPNHRFGWLQARYQLYQTVRKLADAEAIDLVEVPDYQGWAAGWPPLRVPILIRLSGSVTYFQSEMARATDRMTRWLERSSLQGADAWCSESQYLAGRTSEIFGLDRARVPVIYNPVEIPEDPQVARNWNQVVFGGTLTEKKGIVTLVRAWPLVLRECPEARLQVFGKDTRSQGGESMLQRLRDELTPEAQDSVRFRGHVTLDKLRKAFWQAAVAALPSYAEGFALTPIHAMACGCATICGNGSSGPELVEPGVNGLLVDPRSPEDLAAAIVSLLSDPQRAAAIGSQARETASHRFSPDAVIALNEAMYRDCIRNRRQPAAASAAA